MWQNIWEKEAYEMNPMSMLALYFGVIFKKVHRKDRVLNVSSTKFREAHTLTFHTQGINSRKSAIDCLPVRINTMPKK
jgi:hypothetical protein